MKALSRIKTRPLRAMLAVAVCMMLSSYAARSELPDGEGKDIVQTVCSQCHALNVLTKSELSQREWEQLVERMIEFGAPLYGDEVQVVTDYLIKQFGKKTSSDRTEVGDIAITETTAGKLSFASQFEGFREQTLAD